MKTMDAGLDLGELARLHTEALRTEAVYHGDPDALWALQEWQGAEAGYKTAARNAMPDLLALASQAETWRRERDEARAKWESAVINRNYYAEERRREADRADTLARDVEAKDAEIAALKEALRETYRLACEHNEDAREGTAARHILDRAARLAPANGEKGRDDA